MDKVVQRFLQYVTFDTKSDEDAKNCPSTPGQLVFARHLAGELEAIGMTQVSVDENGYVVAALPSNMQRDVPVIGFIAHMDTSPDMPGANVKPQIIDDYDGKNIVLNREKNIILSPSDFPTLKNYTGRTIITTDGTTLLGADDKAGVAEIITACEYLLQHPEIEHGEIKVCFTPDEEIGRGADHFPLDKFGAAFAYTIDGGEIGGIEFENFNAASAKISIRGRNVHPGDAKDKMKNSILIGMQLAGKLPERETPSHTEGYDGFYHLNDFTGSVEDSSMKYIIRDFDRGSFAKRKDYMQKVVNDLNDKYGKGTVQVEIKDQYLNMRDIMEKHMHVVDMACQAIEMAGIRPVIAPIRGGTDGARLSYMGLPCPNIFTGGHNYHGKYEYIPVFAMQKAVSVIINIAELGGRL